MKKKKKVWLSLLLSFILPSLGQFYNGQLRRGSLFLIILIFLSAIQRLTIVAPLADPLLGLIFIFSIYIILDAYEETRRINKEKPLSDTRRAVVALLITLLFLGTRIPGTFLVNNIAGKMRELKSYYIPSISMEPTLKKGDRLLFDTLAYKEKRPQRGDLVAFRDPRNPHRVYIKRVIALEGEKIEIKEGKVYVEDKPLEEPYLREKILEDFKPLKVPPNSLFLLGDNRNQSIDSRHLGSIRLKNILGEAAKIYWPLKRRRKF